MPYQKSGIPLPVNPAPDGLRCIALYIPDDDRYLEALGGQVTELAKWTTWEKRGDESARIAAEVWKDANDLTFSELWTKGLIMTCENVQELIDIIAGLQQTSIDNANKLVSAINSLSLTTAPLDCLPCGERVEVPPLPVANPDPLNPPNGIPANEWEDYLCRAGNYLWYEHVMNGGAELVLAYTTGGSILAVGTIAAVMYASGIGAPIAFLLTIGTAIAGIAAIYTATELEVALEALAPQMICAVVESSGVSELEQAWRDILDTSGVEQPVIDYIFAATGSNAFNQIYDGTMDVPVSFIEPYDCNQCGGTGQFVRVFEDSGVLFLDVEVGTTFELPASFEVTGFGGSNKMYLIYFYDQVTAQNVEVDYDVVSFVDYTVANNPNNPFTAQDANLLNQFTTRYGFQVPLQSYNASGAFKVQLNSGQSWTVTLRINSITSI